MEHLDDRAAGRRHSGEDVPRHFGFVCFRRPLEQQTGVMNTQSLIAVDDDKATIHAQGISRYLDLAEDGPNSPGSILGELRARARGSRVHGHSALDGGTASC
jgi:hypothetical protein